MEFGQQRQEQILVRQTSPDGQPRQPTFDYDNIGAAKRKISSRRRRKEYDIGVLRIKGSDLLQEVLCENPGSPRFSWNGKEAIDPNSLPQGFLRLTLKSRNSDGILSVSLSP